MWILLVTGVGLVLFFLLLASPVTVSIKYTYNSEENSGPDRALKLSTPVTGVRLTLLWGLVKLRLRLSSAGLGFRALRPVLKLRARLAGRSGSTLAREKTRVTPGRAWHLYKIAAGLYRATYPAQRYLLAGTTLHRFSWRTGLGLWEAGQTGLAVGMLWVLKSNLTARVYGLLKKPAPRPELEIKPLFNDRVALWMQLNCIFSLRLGHIIYAGMLAGWLYLKNRQKVWGY